MSIGLNLSLMLRGATAVGGSYDLAANWFGGSEVGFYIDPSNTSTLWTDAGRTTNVTADGQTVLAVDDASGNGNNSVSAQCTYRTAAGLHWLEFDDSAGDFIQMPSVVWGATQYYSVAIGLRRLNADTSRIVFESSVNTNNTQGFIGVIDGSGQLSLHVNDTNDYCQHAAALAVGTDAAAILYADRQDGPGEIKRVELNGVAIPNAQDENINNSLAATQPVYIGGRAGSSLHVSMRLYGLAIAAAQIPDADLSAAGNLMYEKYGGSGAGPF